MATQQPLLLVSRRDMVRACDDAGGEKVIRSLANATRQGFRLVAAASQGLDWSRKNAESKRTRVGPKRLRDRLAEAGGILDGVYYIPRSLMTQRTRNEEALRDLVARFGVEAGDCHLVSSDRPLLAAAGKLKLNTYRIDDKTGLAAILDQMAH